MSDKITPKQKSVIEKLKLAIDGFINPVTTIKIELSDGGHLEAEKLEVGQAVSQITDKEPQPASDGSYTTVDGKTLIVVDGKITELKEKVDDDELVTAVMASLKLSNEKINADFEARHSAIQTRLETAEGQVKELNDLLVKMNTTLAEVMAAPVDKPDNTIAPIVEPKEPQVESYADRIQKIRDNARLINKRSKDGVVNEN